MNLSLEQIKAHWVSDEEEVKPILVAPPIYRIDSNDDRYYYRLVEDLPLYYLSVTSFCSHVLPKNKYLINYLIETGFEKSEEVLHYTGSRGTFLHVEIQDSYKRGYFESEELGARLQAHMINDGIPMYKFNDWLDLTQQDLIGFATWANEVELELIAIEYPVWSNIGLAGCIDLVGYINYKGARRLVIIDIKSGRKGLYEAHELQLATYKYIWNSMFAELGFQVDYAFNWAPKNYKREPTWHFQEQSSRPTALSLPHYIGIFQDGRDKGKYTPRKTVWTINEKIPFGADPKGYYSKKDYNDIILAKHADKFGKNAA